MTEIDYYWFPLSPYCYLAGTGLEDLAKRHGANINYRPFNLLEVFAATGTAPPKDRHVSRRKYRLRDIERSAAMADLPVNVTPAHWPTNPAPAVAAVIVAQQEGGGDMGRLCHGILRAVWAEERDIAGGDVIADCLSTAGFSPDQDAGALAEASTVFAANTSLALERLVFGAPTYAVGDELFWGHDRLSHLDAYLKG